ncbi:Poliovirus receptor-related protein 2 [Gryllus bimaculatus]|nr:Poliovirus receptor-related protein 2 [Gryllus bimaculatus]
MAETEAVAGGVAKLACDMHVSDATFEDKVTLVIWFKEGVSSPIYSIRSALVGSVFNVISNR